MAMGMVDDGGVVCLPGCEVYVLDRGTRGQVNGGSE